MVCARLTKMLMAVKVNMTDITQRLHSTHRNLLNSTCDSAEERFFQSGRQVDPAGLQTVSGQAQKMKVKQ